MESETKVPAEFKSNAIEIANQPKFDIENYLKTEISPEKREESAKIAFELNETDSLNINNIEKGYLNQENTDQGSETKNANGTSHKKNCDPQQNTSEKTFSFDLDLKSVYSLTDGVMSMSKYNTNNDGGNSNLNVSEQNNIQFCTPNKYNFDQKMIKTNEKPSGLNQEVLMDKTLLTANTNTPQGQISSEKQTPIKQEEKLDPKMNDSTIIEDIGDEVVVESKFPENYQKVACEAYELDCCNCKKSQCLKQYCECFRNGRYCKKECLCIECHNLKEYENLRLKAVLKISARNPLAFKPKIEKLVSNETQDVKFHTRGCNCKRSKCLLKYCECFQNGVPCTEFCNCCNCHNTKADFNGRDQKGNGGAQGVLFAKDNKKQKGGKKYGKNKDKLLEKRDDIGFGYESIDIKSDLKHTKVGTFKCTDCQDAIFQSESEDTNRDGIFSGSDKKDEDNYTSQDQHALFLKNQLILNSNQGFGNSENSNYMMNNDLTRLINKNRDIFMS